MTSIKLYYFPFNGRGEATRLALKIGNVPFEDVRLTFPEFKAQETKFPLGQLPALEVGSKMIGQSLAILRYAGRLAKLYPEDALAAAEVDEILADVDEILYSHNGLTKTLNVTSDSERFEKRGLVNKEVLPWVLKPLEDRLAANPSGFLVGSSLTIADLHLVTNLENWVFSGFFDYLRCDVIDAFPRVKALLQKVFDIPVVAEHRKQFPSLIIRKLYDFEAPSRGETTRLTFAAGGVPFEDVQIKGEDFEKYSADFPLGAVPVLKVFSPLHNDYHNVCESDAIVRYASKAAGMYPSDPLEALRVDECHQIIEDAIKGLLKPLDAPDDQKRVLCEEWAKDSAPAIFKALESVAAANATNGWYVGSTMTSADIGLFNFLKALNSGFFPVKDLLPAAPHLSAISEKVSQVPSIVAYYARQNKA